MNHWLAKLLIVFLQIKLTFLLLAHILNDKSTGDPKTFFAGENLGGGPGVLTLPPGDNIFAFKICLPHQSVMPLLNGATPPEKNPGSRVSFAEERALEVRKQLEKELSKAEKRKKQVEEDYAQVMVCNF